MPAPLLFVKIGTTSRKAFGIVSSILKSSKIDGRQANLSELSISIPTLDRKRVQSRNVVMEQTIQEFEEKKPKLAALYWDDKMFRDVNEHVYIIQRLVSSVI